MEQWSTVVVRDSDGGSWCCWRQLSYAIKTQFKAPKAPSRSDQSSQPPASLRRWEDISDVCEECLTGLSLELSGVWELRSVNWCNCPSVAVRHLCPLDWTSQHHRQELPFLSQNSGWTVVGLVRNIQLRKMKAWLSLITVSTEVFC